MTVQAFDYQHLAPRVKAVLAERFPENTAVDVSEGYRGRVDVVIVSEGFKGLPEDDKQDRVWDVLRRELDDEAAGVGLVLVYGTDEL